MSKSPMLLGAALAVAGLIFTSSLGTASAHILRQNNGISAELHIPPSDHPVADQPTQLELSFGDDKNAFSLPDCNCRLQITQNNKVLQSYPAMPSLEGATLDATVTTSFPATGRYDVLVIGQPKDSAFHAFQLSYPVWITESAAAISGQAKKSTGALYVIAVCVLVIIGLLGYVISQNRRSRPV